MCPRRPYTDLTTMGGTGPMRIIFGTVIKSWYISPNIKFGVSRESVWFVCEVPDPVDRYSPFSIPEYG